MRVWLDDVRPPHKDYDTWVQTAEEAIKLLLTGEVTEISLDHDLGDESTSTGYDVALFLEEQAYLNIIPRVKWNVHSANPVGVQNMKAALSRADKYWTERENDKQEQKAPMGFDQMVAELVKAHSLFERSQSPLDREYMLYAWRKLDNYLLSVSSLTETSHLDTFK